MITRDQKKIISLDSGISAWMDTETGLVWEVKNNGNLDYMYVWNKGSLASIEEIVTEDCKRRMEHDVRDCESYIDRMNAKDYAGYDDWRLPTIDELKTLLHRDENGLVNVKAPLWNNCMQGTWSDTPALAVSAFNVTDDWRNESYIPTILVLDLSKMSAVQYDPRYGLWIRTVREE